MARVCPHRCCTRRSPRPRGILLASGGMHTDRHAMCTIPEPLNAQWPRPVGSIPGRLEPIFSLGPPVGGNGQRDELPQLKDETMTILNDADSVRYRIDPG